MNFKFNLLITALIILITLPASAAKWRVNNTLSVPDQVDYNQLKTAVEDDINVLSGDTIYVEGSAIAYDGEVQINRQLTIIGPGYLLETNPNVCNHLNVFFSGGPSILLNSGSDGTYISGLNLISSNSSSGIRIEQNSSPISNITITRNRIYNISIQNDTQVSFLYINRNLICNDILFYNNSTIDNLHITNNLIVSDIRDVGSIVNISNSSVRNNTLKANSRIWMEGSEISYNYVGKIESEPNNSTIHHNILAMTNDADNLAIKTVDFSNICSSYDDSDWSHNDDNWVYIPVDQTSTHGAYNGENPFLIPFANLPAWPIIQSCDIQACGDSTIQVQFQIRTNQ